MHGCALSIHTHEVSVFPVCLRGRGPMLTDYPLKRSSAQLKESRPGGPPQLLFNSYFLSVYTVASLVQGLWSAAFLKLHMTVSHVVSLNTLSFKRQLTHLLQDHMLIVCSCGWWSWRE